MSEFWLRFLLVAIPLYIFLTSLLLIFKRSTVKAGGYIASAILLTPYAIIMTREMFRVVSSSGSMDIGEAMFFLVVGPIPALIAGAIFFFTKVSETQKLTWSDAIGFTTATAIWFVGIGFGELGLW
jgi:hypothetical protein